MRRRLLVSTLAVAVVAVLLLGLPLAVAVRKLMIDDAHRQLKNDASELAEQVSAAYDINPKRPPRPEQIQRLYPNRHIVITPPKGPNIEAGTPLLPGVPKIVESAQAKDNARVRVRMTLDARQVYEDATGAQALIGALGLLAIAVAVGLARLQANRLTLPLEDLAETAERLGSGQARPLRHRYGIPELDRVAEVLDQAAVRIADLLAAEREFATDASHQLRTPLTALSMRLEELIASADDAGYVREEGEAALHQVERLTAVIDELLSYARRQRSERSEPVDLDEVIEQQVEEWEPAFRRAGRSLSIGGQPGLRALATPSGLKQIMSSLLENALSHGAGTVTISRTASDRSIVVEVTDEGEGVPADLAPRIFDRHVSGKGGTGLGLTLARVLADADGGRLELVRPRPPAFAIFLRPVGGVRAASARVVSGPA